MDALGVDEVVVVEDEVKLAREGGHLVDERRYQRLDPRRLGRAQRGQDALPEPLLLDGPPERGDEVREKASRIVVSLVQREPGYGTPPPTRFSTHLPSSVVLPKPAGAETSVSLRPASGSSLSARRGLATSLGRDCDGRSLVDTSGSNALLTSPSGPRFYPCFRTCGVPSGSTYR